MIKLDFKFLFIYIKNKFFKDIITNKLLLDNTNNSLIYDLSKNETLDPTGNLIIDQYDLQGKKLLFLFY